VLQLASHSACDAVSTRSCIAAGPAPTWPISVIRLQPAIFPQSTVYNATLLYDESTDPRGHNFQIEGIEL
jgi:hypothetical protein